MSENLPSNLRLLCAEWSSIAQVCREIGLNRQQFNRYLSGEASPSAHNLYRIARHFGVSERALLEDHETFRTVRRSKTTTAADGPANRLVDAFASQSKPLRRYLGFYHGHFLSPAWPEKIMRALIWLREERGFVVTHSFERGDDHKRLDKLRTRLSGLAAWRGSRIYIFENELSDDGVCSETILCPPPRLQVQYIRGMIMGVATRPRMTPYASPLIWKRVPERVTAREALRTTGVFPKSDKSIDPIVREFLLSGELTV